MLQAEHFLPNIDFTYCCLMLVQTYFCEAEKPTTAAFADFYCSVIEAKPLNSAAAALFSRTCKCIFSF